MSEDLADIVSCLCQMLCGAERYRTKQIYGPQHVNCLLQAAEVFPVNLLFPLLHFVIIYNRVKAPHSAASP